jgi:hypothetical protein
MDAGKVEIHRHQLPRAQRLQVRRTQLGKLGEQSAHAVARIPLEMAEAVIGLEARIGSARQNDANP